MKSLLKSMKQAAKNNIVTAACVRFYGDSKYTFSYTELVGYGGIFHVYVKQETTTEAGIATITYKIVAHNQRTAHNAINYAGKKLLNVKWETLK